MQERRAGAPFGDHRVDRRDVIGVVLDFAAFLVFRRVLIRNDELVFRLVDGDRLDDGVDFFIRNEGALPANELARAGEEEQHIAVPEELLRAFGVQNDLTVGAARDAERDARREVRLDQTGNDVDRRLLRRQDQVNTDRAALLRQTDDVPLDVFARRHNHIRHFVGDNDDARHRFRERRPFLFVARLQALALRRFRHRVEFAEFAGADGGENLVSLLHLLDGPFENRLGLLHIDDDRVHQVRNRFVRAQLDHFRVDHNQLHLFRRTRH